MIERGILFSAPMVRALLDGSKTQTRRLVTVPWKGSKRALPYEPWWVESDGKLLSCDEYGDHREVTEVMAPYGRVGDRLWVRETWHPCDAGPVLFAADYDSKEQAGVQRWYPGIHLRRVHARLLLELTGVRIERLDAISEEDAKAEGVKPFEHDPEGDCWTARPRGEMHRSAFEYLWGEINGWDGEPGARAPWPTNPWVWVLSFKVLETKARAA